MDWMVHLLAKAILSFGGRGRWVSFDGAAANGCPAAALLSEPTVGLNTGQKHVHLYYQYF